MGKRMLLLVGIMIGVLVGIVTDVGTSAVRYLVPHGGKLWGAVTLILGLTAPGALAAWLTYMHYRKQHEHDLVRKRYLDEGLDTVTMNVDHASLVYAHNHATAVELLALFRAYGAQMGPVDASAFHNVDLTRLNGVAGGRLIAIVGSTAVWQCVQNLFAFVAVANLTFKHDLAPALDLFTKGSFKSNLTQQQIYDEYLRRIVQLDERFEKQVSILTHLHTLTHLFEREKFTFDTVNRFRDRDDVKGIIGTVQGLVDAVAGELRKKQQPAPVAAKTR